MLAVASIQRHGTIRLTFGDARTSPVAARDVADVVTRVLTDPPRHIGRVYELTGAASRDMTAIAAEFPGALGRPVIYVDVPYEDCLEHDLQPLGLSPHLLDHIATMARLHKQNGYDKATSDIADLLGRPPSGFDSLIRDTPALRITVNRAQELVTRNVAAQVKAPPMVRQRRPDLTVEQARHLLEVIKGERLEAFYVLALTTGLRRGELLGLRWADVDLNSRQLHVRRALQRVGGKLRFVEPKTSTSVRVVVVPKLAVRHLAQHRARQDTERLARGAAWRDHDLVFASSVGTPIKPRNVNRRWDELRERAGLDWLRLHDLRHGCATFMMAAGVPARTIMEVLGHSEIGVTMNTYTHVLAQLREDAADAIDRVLGA
jgi:integrase